MTAATLPLIWDAHSNLPLEASRSIDDLEQHRNQGFSFVSLNVGYDPAPLDQIITAIAGYRQKIAQTAGISLVRSIRELEIARDAGNLAVAFDLEGALPLLETPCMAALWSELGVRQMHLAYNRNNSASGGCYDYDVQLTPLGREFVLALNSAGIVVDCSHGGERATLDIMACSEKPVVFSHSCVKAVHPHPRNISDRQIDACADTGGVIGIVGYSRFLGTTPSRAEDMVKHILYVAERVGPQHVGIGWDYGYPAHGPDPMQRIENFAYWFPDAQKNRAEALSPAEIFTPLTEAARLPMLMRGAGLSSAEIEAVLYGNFLRVAGACWPKNTGASR
ncbi:MAG: membrane dipeptidase [Pseudomonadales bacterium]